MRRTRVCVVALCAVLVAVVAPAGAQAATWRALSPVSPLQPASFGGVACPATTVCMVVGRRDNGLGGTTALAELQSSGLWTVPALAIPRSALTTDLAGVSCTAARECTAVGSYHDGVAEQPLIERYTGTWALQTALSPGGALGTRLTAVSCVSSSVCTAVGSYVDAAGVQQPYAIHWAGGSWAIRATPSPVGATGASLAGVSCTSATSCTAVGTYTDSGGVRNALAMGWNGTSWTLQPSLNAAGAIETVLSAVSCTASNACTAVGTYYTFTGAGMVAERWTTRWTLQTAAPPAGASDAGATGVSCTSATHCSAAGVAVTAGAASSMAQIWNGAGWSVETTPSPAGAIGSGLAGIACRTSTLCTAAGDWFDSGGIQRVLALGYS